MYNDNNNNITNKTKQIGSGGKRSRREFDTEDDPAERERERMDRIHKLLVRIGERSSSPLAHNCNELSKALLVDIPHYREFIIDTLFDCVTHLTTKLPIYATLVGLINAAQSDFGSDVVKRLINELQDTFIVAKGSPKKKSKNGNNNNNNNNSNNNSNNNTSTSEDNSETNNSSNDKSESTNNDNNNNNNNTSSNQNEQNSTLHSRKPQRPPLEPGLPFDFNRMRLLVCCFFFVFLVWIFFFLCIF